jgi:hypothetical protein
VGRCGEVHGGEGGVALDRPCDLLACALADRDYELKGQTNLPTSVGFVVETMQFQTEIPMIVGIKKTKAALE